MNKKQLNMLKLQQISTLPDNWDGYGAETIPSSLIDICSDVIQKLEIQPDVFPTARNSIQFEYEKITGDYLEFELYIDKVEVFFQSDFEEFYQTYKYEEVDWNHIIQEYLT